MSKFDCLERMRHMTDGFRGICEMIEDGICEKCDIPDLPKTFKYIRKLIDTNRKDCKNMHKILRIVKKLTSMTYCDYLSFALYDFFNETMNYIKEAKR